MRPRLVIAFAVAALLAVARGVVAVRTAPDPRRVLVAASRKLEAQETASFRMTMTGSMGGTPLSMSGAGQVDMGRGLTSMTMTMPVAGRSVRIEEVTEGTTAYVRMPEAGVTDWMSMDVGAMLGADPAQAVAGDPSASLDMLAQVVGEIETVGAEEIDGVSVTHYRTTIGTPAPAGAAAAAQPLAGIALPIPTEVWVDEQGLPRRQTMVLRFEGTLQGSSLTTTIDYRDFGDPTKITVPDPSTVTPIPASALRAGAAATP